ncbi:GyrI-like domain-containing protein [Lacrimispora sp.]|uniref:GyrI-like domain-containing protein n=1 Tax=Lacrimispora sp. TaxID=2719234 RepID=UPI003FA5B4AD
MARFRRRYRTRGLRFYGEWFPASGYELTGRPELLWNETPDTSRPDYKSEIWIPVRKIDG